MGGSIGLNALGAKSHDTTAASESFIEAAKVDSSNTILAQGARTHDAWLDSDVKVCLV